MLFDHVTPDSHNFRFHISGYARACNKRRQLADCKLHARCVNHGRQISGILCDAVCVAAQLRSCGQKQLQDVQSELILQVNREAIIRVQCTTPGVTAPLVTHLMYCLVCFRESLVRCLLLTCAYLTVETASNQPVRLPTRLIQSL